MGWETELARSPFFCDSLSAGCGVEDAMLEVSVRGSWEIELVLGVFR